MFSLVVQNFISSLIVIVVTIAIDFYWLACVYLDHTLTAQVEFVPLPKSVCSCLSAPFTFQLKSIQFVPYVGIYYVKASYPCWLVPSPLLCKYSPCKLYIQLARRIFV